MVNKKIKAFLKADAIQIICYKYAHVIILDYCIVHLTYVPIFEKRPQLTILQIFQKKCSFSKIHQSGTKYIFDE